MRDALSELLPPKSLRTCCSCCRSSNLLEAMAQAKSPSNMQCAVRAIFYILH